MVTNKNWVKVELYGANNDGNPIRFTIADGTSVSQGQLLELTDPRTVTAADGSSTIFAGVAAEEHLANEGITSIAVHTDGIFEVVASGAITLGDPVTGENNNVKRLRAATSETSGALTADLGAANIGYALETATDEETINIRLRL